VTVRFDNIFGTHKTLEKKAEGDLIQIFIRNTKENANTRSMPEKWQHFVNCCERRV